LNIIKRPKYPLFITYGVNFFYIVGSTTRNAFFKIFTLRIVQPTIHLKKICKPQCIYKLFCFASCTTNNLLWCSDYHLSLTLAGCI